MKNFLILILPLFLYSCSIGQIITFENTTGVVDTVPNNSILIVIGDVSCGQCLHRLNHILAKVPSHMNFFVYFDSQLLPTYSRQAKVLEIQTYLSDFAVETVFLPAGSKVLLTSKFNFCDVLASPYLLVHKSSVHSSVICHKDMFDTNKTIRQLRIELKEKLE